MQTILISTLVQNRVISATLTHPCQYLPIDHHPSLDKCVTLAKIKQLLLLSWLLLRFIACKMIIYRYLCTYLQVSELGCKSNSPLVDILFALNVLSDKSNR